MTSFLQVRSWGDERVSIWNWSRSKFLIGKISVLAKAFRIQMFIYNQLFGAEELKVDLLSIGRANVNKKWFSRHHLNSPAVQMTIRPRRGNVKHSSFLFIASPRLERLCFVNLILITIEKALINWNVSDHGNYSLLGECVDNKTRSCASQSKWTLLNKKCGALTLSHLDTCSEQPKFEVYIDEARPDSAIEDVPGNRVWVSESTENYLMAKFRLLSIRR